MIRCICFLSYIFVMSYSPVSARSWHERPDRMFHAHPLVEMSESGRVFARAKVTRVLRAPTRRMSGLLRAEVTSGEYMGCDLHAKTFFVLHARNLTPGHNFIISFLDENGVLSEIVVDSKDRLGGLVLISIIFIFMVFMVGGRRSFFPVLCLPIGILIFWQIIGGALKDGKSPIIAASFSAVIVVALTMIAIGGLTKKSIVSAIGAIVGLGFTVIVSWLFISSSIGGGFFYEEIQLLNYYYSSGADFFNALLTALVILGATGIVMDTSVSVSSTMAELRRQSPDISDKNLSKVGIRVGREISSTMASTLIVAYLGSSLIILISRSLHITTFTQLINADFFNYEVYRALFGVCAFLIASRISAWIGSRII